MTGAFKRAIRQGYCTNMDQIKMNAEGVNRK
jgi:hypothetical protein